MIHQNTHRKAVALREAALAFAEHKPDDYSDPNDRKGQRLNAALLDAALEYAQAVDPDYHLCTKCDKPLAPHFSSRAGATHWCGCAPRPRRP